MGKAAAAGWVLFLLVFAIVANVCNGVEGLADLLSKNLGRQHTWAITLLTFVLLIASAGFGAKGRWDGVLIDDRNRISLARFQLILWTTLLVSALFTSALTNSFQAPVTVETLIGLRKFEGALNIDIPPAIWTLLGLGSFTAVASPVLLYIRTLRLGDVKNVAADETSWLQLITSDTDPTIIDITKIQQLAFTVLLVAAYAISLWQETLSGIARITRFPAVDDGFVALLGISHAAYLAVKFPPVTRSSK